VCRGANYDFLKRVPKVQDMFTLQSVVVSPQLLDPDHEVSAEDEGRMHKAAQALEAMRRNITIRVTLDIPCSETFYIKNSDTGDIIQGSEQPVERTHQVLLEVRKYAGVIFVV